LRWCDSISDPIITDGAPHLNWKNDEPSNDPLKACVAAEYSPLKPPFFTFFKADCNALYFVTMESKGPVELDFFYPFRDVQPK
jgi:hypothetical protein